MTPKKKSISDKEIDQILEIANADEKKVEKEAEIPFALRQQLNENPLITNRKDCLGCNFWNRLTEKCELTTVSKCSCNNPQLLMLYRHYDDIGFCKNCFHFIIRIGNKAWNHYNRAYSCKFPYNEVNCIFPIENFEKTINDLHDSNQIKE